MNVILVSVVHFVELELEGLSWVMLLLRLLLLLLTHSSYLAFASLSRSPTITLEYSHSAGSCSSVSVPFPSVSKQILSQMLCPISLPSFVLLPPPHLSLPPAASSVFSQPSFPVLAPVVALTGSSYLPYVLLPCRRYPQPHSPTITPRHHRRV